MADFDDIAQSANVRGMAGSKSGVTRRPTATAAQWAELAAAARRLEIIARRVIAESGDREARRVLGGAIALGQLATARAGEALGEE